MIFYYITTISRWSKWWRPRDDDVIWKGMIMWWWLDEHDNVYKDIMMMTMTMTTAGDLGWWYDLHKNDKWLYFMINAVSHM